MTGTGIEIVYDGQCPFCASYVAMVRLREAVGPVALIDARSGDPRVADLLRAGFDLDAGMVVTWQGRHHHGADAVHLLARLSGETSAGSRLQRLLFGASARAAVVYPVLAAGRRLFLRLARRTPIAADRRKAP